MHVDIHESRKNVLADEFEQPYFHHIKEELIARKEKWEIIYPPGSLIFNAFNLTPFEQVRVVLIGQDPYHWPGQAHGLCFSVQEGVKPPPSLVNIFQEIKTDVGGEIPKSWNLTHRAEQGVLLLNAILTVTAGQPASHQNMGRETFTNAVIKKISNRKSWVIFLLRGNFARSKKELIDLEKHIVLEAAHPSPFSVHKGFFWCKHFSAVNQILAIRGEKEITWM